MKIAMIINLPRYRCPGGDPDMTGCSVMLMVRRQGQRRAESWRRIVQLQHAAVQVGDRGDQGETQAGARRVPCRFAAIEPLCRLEALRVRNPRPLVADGDGN